MSPKRFVRELQSLKFGHVFNPYSDQCSEHDRRDAAKRRSSTLLAMLTRAANVEIEAVWLGRDLGHRGGRRTGLAFTDDVHLNTHMIRWNLETRCPTREIVISEQTAKVVWSILSNIEDRIFLWNVFPFHPHLPNDEFSNRQHNVTESRVGEDLLHTLLEILRPNRLISVGNDAARAAIRVYSVQRVTKVRHPSYGGAILFRKQIEDLYGCQINSK